jgi:SAM-dependent methyltransferase
MTGSYDSLEVHRGMLLDAGRVDAFRRALHHAVRAGDTVLDLGAGTGVLSLLAVQAGAAHVYAVERSSIATVAAALAERNGYGSRVSVIQADIDAVEVPHRVDVIVSEWLGVYGVDENLLATVLRARDRWLRPGGTMLPGRVVSWLAPVWLGESARESAYFRSRPHDLDLELIGELAAQQIAWPRAGVHPGQLRADPLALWRVDVARCPLGAATRTLAARLTFTADGAGALNGLAAWFEAGFGGGIALTNAPWAPPTHWGQFVFPLARTYRLAAGTTIQATFRCIPGGPGYCEHAWSVKVGRAPWEHHDTRDGGGSAWCEV